MDEWNALTSNSLTESVDVLLCLRVLMPFRIHMVNIFGRLEDSDCLFWGCLVCQGLFVRTLSFLTVYLNYSKLH